ncbi:MAG: site-specific DNA-methyltransferase [Synechococcaceae bacterium WBB_34_004]|nr:site-specific DNA-methyltransferase [Synechococcaceae bacterium WBB_34_004]
MKVKVLQGDCIEQLKTIEDKSVHCCVTSPPYWGLRDYGHEGQLGLEATPEDYVTKMVQVFREVRRVLREDATLWLNIGDSYSGSGKGPAGNLGATHNERNMEHKHSAIVPDGLKPKDLIGIPWRIAFALQADGWYLRQDIIWHKPNPMPESVRDRCTKAHEHIFLMSKSEKYYYDADSVAEPVAVSTVDRLSQPSLPQQNGSSRVPFKTNGNMKAVGGTETRNRRSVWTVATQPYGGAHFATFPPDLIRPCVLAGCPRGGTVLDPFGGSGTTGQVAMEHGRNAILIELNPQYIGLINRRLADVQPLLLE